MMICSGSWNSACRIKSPSTNCCLNFNNNEKQMNSKFYFQGKVLFKKLHSKSRKEYSLNNQALFIRYSKWRRFFSFFFLRSNYLGGLLKSFHKSICNCLPHSVLCNFSKKVVGVK